MTPAEAQALANVGELAEALIAEPGESTADLARYAVGVEHIERHSHIDLLTMRWHRRRARGW